MECEEPPIVSTTSLVSAVAPSQADAGGAATAKPNAMAAMSEVARRIIGSVLVRKQDCGWTAAFLPLDKTPIEACY